MGRRTQLVLVLTFTAGATFFLLQPLKQGAVPYAKVLLSSEGRLLATRIASDEQWRFPPIKEVPNKLKHAVVEFEDRRFFWHQGVDAFAVVRALFSNLRAGKIVSGASTISMQSVRLMRKSSSRSFTEKAREALLAIRYDLLHSKSDILRDYLSHAPYGGNIVGASAASWFYFNRSLKEISWAEAALLAVLPNNPSFLHLTKNRDRLLAKRNRLLRRLFKKRYFDAADLRLALAQSIPEKPIRPENLAPHLLGKPTAANIAIKYDLQKRVLSGLRRRHDELRGQGIKNMAAVIIDNHSSQIVAYVGNIRGGDGYHVDLALSRRSSGSILKPVLYAGMLDAGEITPETLIFDIPTRFSGFRPQNFDLQYSGAVRAKEALARSLNVPAVRMLKQFTVPRFHSLLRRSGFKTVDRVADHYGLSLIVGGAEVRLLDVVGFYSKIAQKISQPTNNVQLQNSIPISRGAAYLMAEALTEVRRPTIDGFWKTFSSSQKIAWKTGTSHGFRDAWSVGFTPKYTVGVWAGNAYGEGNPQLVGTKTAAPLMFDIFNQLDTSAWFEKPLTELKLIDVCRDSGFLANKLCSAKEIEIPKGAKFRSPDRFHSSIQIDQESGLRAHLGCSNSLRKKVYFRLPALASYYYKKHHADYFSVPEWKPSCAEFSTRKKFDISFPSKNLHIIRTRGLDGRRQRTVLKAVSESESTQLFWHLNRKYLGETHFPHDIEVDLKPGDHRLTVVDDEGNSVKRLFKIL